MKNLIILLCVTFLLSCSSTKEEQQRELQERISRIENNIQQLLQIEGKEVPTYSIDERLKELGIPGLSIAVVADGKIEWAKGYGLADKAENRIVDNTTMFLAGSISKPVSALRAHQLVEQGKLSLDDNINYYLTSWKIPDNEFTTKEKVTL